MSVTGKRVVFIIQPQQERTASRQEWSGVIHRSVLTLLNSFHKSCNPEPCSQVLTSEAGELKWAYRFMNTACLKTIRSMQDWKEFKEDEFLFFENEVRYVAEERDYEVGPGSNLAGGAHGLSEELMSVVHDYAWETSDIISPVKPSAKTRGSSLFENRKQFTKESMENELSCYLLDKLGQDPCKGRFNFVVILGPIPKSRTELDLYFEWHVEDVDYVQRKLMPAHLRTYFRDRHGIVMLWVDTKMCDVTTDVCARDVNSGSNLLEQFIELEGGTVIPISTFGLDCYKRSKDDATPATTVGNAPCLARAVTAEPLKGTPESFSRTNLLDHLQAWRTAECFVEGLHICRKIMKSDKVFQIEKLWSLSGAPLSHPDLKCSSTPWLINHSCTNSVAETSHKDSHVVDFGSDSNDFLKIASSGTCVQLALPLKHGCNTSATVVPESVFIAIGTISTSRLPQIIRSKSLKTLHVMWSRINSEDSPVQRSQIFRNVDAGRVYVFQVHKYCTACDAEPSTDSCPVSKYALFQPFTMHLGLLVYISCSSGVTLASVMRSSTQVLTSESSTNSIGVPLEIWLPPEATETEELTRHPVSFHCSLLEQWCFTAASDKHAWSLLTFEREESHQNGIDAEILEELEHLYFVSAPSIPDLEEKDEDLVSPQPDQVYFESDENMVTVLRDEYDRAIEACIDLTLLDISNDICSDVVRIAHSLVNTVFCHMQKAKGTDWLTEAHNFIKKHFLRSSSELRKQDDRKLKECVLQVLFRLELTSRIPLDDDVTSGVAEEIAALLRLISLSSSPAILAHCLSHVFLENYATACGELLCEVHNEMMQPLPPSLLPYAKSEASEESFVMSSIPNSATSSNPSISSIGSANTNSRTQFQKIRTLPSKSCRQIQVPGGLLQSKRPMSANAVKNTNDHDVIKSRLRSSTKKKINNTSENGMRIRSVKRDLFSTLEGSKPETPRKIEGKQVEKLSVSDTPNTKQGMTALSRQRLRLRKERRGVIGGPSLAVVDESPAKPEEASLACPETQRSPRHKIMIARRHSFYCEGKRSRAATRAKTIQQRQRVAPSTPIAVREQKSSTSESFLGLPDNLVFANISGSIVSPSRVRRVTDKMASVCDDSPAKNTRSQATKALFQSPRRDATSGDEPATQRNFNILNGESVSICGIQPITSISLEREQIPQQPVVEPCTSLRPGTVGKELNETLLDVAERDITSNQVENGIKHGTLDGFVIRTPSQKCTPPSVKARKSQKRKLSVDTTPTRDDINKWPRKKRSVDKSSPGVVSKRKSIPKKNVSPAESPWAAAKKFEGDALLSPDSGLIVYGDGCGIAKSCSALGKPQEQKKILSETNGQQNFLCESVGLDELLKLPPTPKLRLGVKWGGGRSALEQSVERRNPVAHGRTLKEPSALSMLHIQSSPLVVRESRGHVRLSPQQ